MENKKNELNVKNSRVETLFLEDKKGNAASIEVFENQTYYDGILFTQKLGKGTITSQISVAGMVEFLSNSDLKLIRPVAG